MAYLPVKNPQKMEEKPFSEHLICDVMPLFNLPHSVWHINLLRMGQFPGFEGKLGVDAFALFC